MKGNVPKIVLQLITNDKFRSVQHRVLAQEVGPRTSVASFFFPGAANKLKPYGVIKELLSDDTPIYRATHLAEFMGQYMSTGSSISVLSPFKVTRPC
jgi:isopenicillin N synthase-like dioxygenase